MPRRGIAGLYGNSPWNFLRNRQYFRYTKQVIEITSCILSDHNAIKLELNNKRNSRKYLNTWRLNNTLLHDQWIIKEIKGEMKKFLEFKENESITYQNL
jgi:hypothetical protein